MTLVHHDIGARPPVRAAWRAMQLQLGLIAYLAAIAATKSTLAPIDAMVRTWFQKVQSLR
jgi:hypothetical protein